VILRFGGFVLDVDTDKTRAFYNGKYAPTTSRQCKCPGCQNYDKAIMTAPASVLDFLREFGIDPQKPGEVFVLGEENFKYGETLYYGGWYHVVGIIIRRPEEKKTPDYTPDPSFPFSVSFVDDRIRMGWVNSKMPTPIFEIGIDAHLPYVIEDTKKQE